MTASSALPSIYQLRVALHGISPLIWRRRLVRSDTTLARLCPVLQILLAWSDEHRHNFHIHGREYSSSGAPTPHVVLSDLDLHRGERFRYV
jgi:Plasmid pRiA4b ORF-3-like protein